MKKNRVILLTIAACVPAFIQAMDGAQGEEPPAKRQKTNQHFCPYSPGRPPYSDAAGLRNHLRNKHAQNNVFCPICHKGFKTRHGVQLHQAITHIQETAGAATQPAPTNVLSPLDTFSVETSTTTVTALPQQMPHPAPMGLPTRTNSFNDILADLQVPSPVAPQQMSHPAPMGLPTRTNSFNDILADLQVPSPVAPQQMSHPAPMGLPTRTNSFNDILADLQVPSPVAPQQMSHPAPMGLPTRTNSFNDILADLQVPSPVAPQQMSHPAPMGLPTRTNSFNDILADLQVPSPVAPQQMSHPAPMGLPTRTNSFNDILADLQTQSSVAPQQMSWPASVQMQQQQMQQTLGSAPIATTLPQDLLLGDESNLTSPPLANVAIAAAALTQASDTAFEQTQEEKEAIYQQWLNMHPRPRQCPFARCPFSSDKTSNMKRHITCVHLQLKPFRCDACGIRYGQKKNLKIHIETTHQ